MPLVCLLLVQHLHTNTSDMGMLFTDKFTWLKKKKKKKRKKDGKLGLIKNVYWEGDYSIVPALTILMLCSYKKHKQGPT